MLSKVFPSIPEQPSKSLCHCTFIATRSSSNQLDVIASLEKDTFKCWAEFQSSWKGFYCISSSVFIQLLADLFHLCSQLCSMLCFSTFSLGLYFPVSDLSLPVLLLFTHSITMMKMKELLHLNIIQTHSLLPSIDKPKVPFQPLPATPNARSSPFSSTQSKITETLVLTGEPT